MLWQPALDAYYTTLSPEAAAELISQRREQLGESLVILGHHYQADEVVQHADYTGDSLKLSQLAAEVALGGKVKWVIFCGVHFMAETADMLTPDAVEVILPDLSAGCSMADMADYDDTVQAWEAIHEGLQMTLDEGLSLEAALFGLTCASEDMREGTLAFLEKRKPAFSGR